MRAAKRISLIPEEETDTQVSDDHGAAVEEPEGSEEPTDNTETITPDPQPTPEPTVAPSAKPAESAANRIASVLKNVISTVAGRLKSLFRR